MTSESSSTDSNYVPNSDIEETSDKKRTSKAYDYFTFNDEVKLWYCDYCV